MTKTIWHSGPPPSCGWWPASAFNDANCVRWWDGTHWSVPCYKIDKPELVYEKATQKAATDPISWTERPTSWPDRSFT